MSLFSKPPAVRSPKSGNHRRSTVTTYYRADPPDAAASPFKRKTPKRKYRKFLFGFLDIVLIIILLSVLAYSMGVKSRARVIVNDTSFHSLAQYAQAANSQFGQFKNRNKLTFDQQSIATAVQKQYPEISAVAIELPFFSEQATVRLTIARPSFQLNSAGVNYIISANGIIVAKTADLPNLKNLLVVDDQSGFNAVVGKPVLSSDAVGFINTIISECQKVKVPIASLTLPATPEELDLRTADQPYYVKFYLGGDALTEIGQFLASRHHFSQAGQPPAQYLDVRVSGKVFYK